MATLTANVFLLNVAFLLNIMLVTPVITHLSKYRQPSAESGTDFLRVTFPATSIALSKTAHP
jgi:hypothetical protein